MEVGRRPYKWPAKNRLHWNFFHPETSGRYITLHITGDFGATSCESQADHPKFSFVPNIQYWIKIHYVTRILDLVKAFLFLLPYDIQANTS